MKDYKFTTIFSSTIKPLVSEEKDKYLALASLVDVGNFIPNVDTDKDVDLLPVAFNAFVTNRVNKNDDVIDTTVAKDIYKNFINKPINIEHNRERVVGVILTAGFSEFGTDKLISEEELENTKSPFNVTLGGVLWRVTNNELISLIEETSDPTSEDYMKISASWELGFNDYNLLVISEGSKNLEDGEVIADDDKIEQYKDNLKAFGGSGQTEEGKNIYRKVIGSVVPLAIGLTENPAADVKGVATEVTKKEEEIVLSTEEKENLEKSETLISQTNKTNVDITHRNVMKITSLTDITDESVKEISATAISDFIQEELKKASEEYEADKKSKDEALQAATENYKKLQTDHTSLVEQLKSVETTLEELKAEKAARETLERFTRFMSALDEDFNLTDEDRSVLANDVKDMTDDDFKSYRTKMDVLLINKKRTEEVEAEEKVEVKASEEEKPEAKVEEKKIEESTKEETEEILEKAVAVEQDIPNSSEVEEPTLMEKYKNAFSEEGFDISYIKR